MSPAYFGDMYAPYVSPYWRGGMYAQYVSPNLMEVPMPRSARIIYPGVPHHITPRGNRRHPVFFSDEDKSLYLRLLSKWADKAGSKIWAYCLMDNHVHHVAVPETEDGLAVTFG